MSLKEEEIGISEGCLGHGNRSMTVLLDKLDLARSILEHAGIDTNPRLIIQGETLGDQLQWLEDALVHLEGAILSAQAEQKALLEDEATREHEVMVHWPAVKQIEMKMELRRQTEECEREVIAVEEDLKNHFEKRSQNVDISPHQKDG